MSKVLIDQQPASGGDERAAFEAWCASIGYTLKPCGEGNGYKPNYGSELWSAWQARATLAQSERVPEGFRVIKPTSAVVRDGDRWEIYAPCGSGGIVHEDDVTDWVVRKLLDALAAASAPASGGDERAAFEAWYLDRFHMGDKQCGLEWLSTEPCGGYRHQHPAEQWAVWQARAALPVRQPLRYTNDGELAECPCCGSLDVGGAHDTVNCYGCGLQITKPRPLQNAADAWNKRAALAQSERVPEGWRPISSAPADGQKALVYRPLARKSQDEPVAVKRLIGGNNHCWESTVPDGEKPTNPTDGSCHVTHWMPLPAAPSPSKQGGV